MNTLIETIIYLVTVIGIIAVIGSFFQIFTNSKLDYLNNKVNKIFDFKKSKINEEKTVTVEIYLNNMTDEDSEKVTEVIKKNKKLNEVADYINIYKTFDKK